MSEQTDHQRLEQAVQRLVETERGTRAAIDLLAFLEHGAVSLDRENQAAAMELLTAAWAEHPGTVLDLLREHTGN